LSERLSERPTTTSKPVSGTDVVTVACKIPSGIRIAAHVWEEYDEPASSEERAKDEGRECAAELSGFEPVQVGAPGEKIPDRRLGRDRLSPHTFEGPRR